MTSSSTRTNTKQLSVLKVSDLNIVFGKKTLVKGLSFEIGQAAFIAVVGHNGCGKTTFFKAITGKIGYEGDILALGRDIRVYKPFELSKVISFLEQKNPVSFSMPVKELVVMGRYSTKKLFDNYNSEDYRLVSEALERLGIGELEERDFLGLSGGEQQLVWLAQMLLQDADIYLLDEPAQYLDIYNRKKLYDLLQWMVNEKKKTVLCITHDLTQLRKANGYMINLSSSSPSVEKLSEISVNAAIEFLEKGKP